MLNLDDMIRDMNSYRRNGTFTRQSRRILIKNAINHMADKTNITSGSGEKREMNRQISCIIIIIDSYHPHTSHIYIYS